MSMQALFRPEMDELIVEVRPELIGVGAYGAGTSDLLTQCAVVVVYGDDHFPFIARALNVYESTEVPTRIAVDDEDITCAFMAPIVSGTVSHAIPELLPQSMHALIKKVRIVSCAHAPVNAKRVITRFLEREGAIGVFVATRSEVHEHHGDLFGKLIPVGRSTQLHSAHSLLE